jgi:hypothetical protein
MDPDMDRPVGRSPGGRGLFSHPIIPGLFLLLWAPHVLHVDLTIALTYLAELILSETNLDLLKAYLSAGRQWVTFSLKFNQQSTAHGLIFTCPAASDPLILPEFSDFLAVWAENPLFDNEQRIQFINILIQSINSGNEHLIRSASLALSRLILPQGVQLILESNIWNEFVMTFQQSERFATNENMLKVMCALIRNGNVEQTVMIVDFGFLDIVKTNVDLIKANLADCNADCLSTSFFLTILGFSPSPPFCILTKYLHNGNLTQFLSDETTQECVTPSHSTLMTTSFLHSLHIIDRDLKSPSVLLDDNLLPGLTDFGIARGRELENLRTAGLGTPH